MNYTQTVHSNRAGAGVLPGLTPVLSHVCRCSHTYGGALTLLRGLKGVSWAHVPL